MIIDTNTYVGHWPFRKLINNTLTELDALAQENGITHMLVANVQGVFYKDSMQGNLELAQQLADYSGKTKFNPTYPAWRDDMKKCVSALGFQCIELCPVYHGYSLAREGVEAFRLAGELGVCVRILDEFENIRQQHRLDVKARPAADDIAAMLAACPNTGLILNGFIPCYMGEKLKACIAKRDNVVFDICRIDTFDHVSGTWERTLEYAGVQKICFGSLSPFYYLVSALTRLHFSPHTDAEKAEIAADNVKKILKYAL